VKSNPGIFSCGGLSSPFTTVLVPKIPVSPPSLLTLPDRPSLLSDCEQYSEQVAKQYSGSLGAISLQFFTQSVKQSVAAFAGYFVTSTTAKELDVVVRKSRLVGHGFPPESADEAERNSSSDGHITMMLMSREKSVALRLRYGMVPYLPIIIF
jgi:hypothetical protein